MRRLALILAVLALISGRRARRTSRRKRSPPLRRSPIGSSPSRQEAHDKGFSDALLNQTLEGLEPLEHVVQSDRSQAELNPGFARYLSTRLTNTMIRRGKEMAVRTPNRPRPGRAQVRRAASLPAGALGNGDTLRPCDGKHAGVPGARHARMGAATRHAISVASCSTR